MNYYNHLDIKRVDLQPPRRRSGGGPPLRKPKNILDHATNIKSSYTKVSDDSSARKSNQFDPNLLLKLRIQKGKVSDDQLKSFGARLIAEEGSDCLIVFFDDEAKNVFLERLEKYSKGETGKGVNASFFHAIYDIESWTREDRESDSLKKERPFDHSTLVTLDVEFWPLETKKENDEMFSGVRGFVEGNGGSILDTFVVDNVVLAKVEIDNPLYDELLEMKYVRFVDFPPALVMDFASHFQDGGDFHKLYPPPEGSSFIAVLDTGVVPAHPYISSALIEARSFIEGDDAIDENGHGTAVAGFCLHGDLTEKLADGKMNHQIQLLSGKVLDGNGEYSRRLIANQVLEAVKYFYNTYGCRVYNLSLGDRLTPYDGQHVKGLSVVLDKISKEFDVVFVVSVGNLRHGDNPCDWRSRYPNYLLDSVSKIIDPGTSIHALTVGSIAREEKTFASVRNPRDVNQVAIAGINEPSPFTRSGLGAAGSIKPDFVEYGGNWYIDKFQGGGTIPVHQDPVINETIVNHDFHRSMLAKGAGTSYSAPKIAHAVGMLLNHDSNLSSNKIRALLGVSAQLPEQAEGLKDKILNFSNDDLFSLYGYGKPVLERAIYSSDNSVVMCAEDSIDLDAHHFYEVPLPNDFFREGKRLKRKVVVSLAHTSDVRSTRLSYKSTRVSFKVVEAASMDEVEKAFHHQAEADNIPEKSGFFPSSTLRGKGTLQVSSKNFSVFRGQNKLKNRKSRLFVVVTCQSEGWGDATSSDYALAIRVEDTEETGLNMYAQCRDIIRSRVRGRTRPRVQV